jgi:outer membrane beta-barrel protein
MAHARVLNLLADKPAKASRGLAFALCASFWFWFPAQAQDSGGGDEIEQLFMQTQQGAPSPTPAPGESRTLEQIQGTAPVQPGSVPEAPAAQDKRFGEDFRQVSDLATLSSYTDIAVIQKRFLPKTKRFEAYLGLSAILNDPFFTNFGGTARGAYYFREQYGVELVAMFLATRERDVTTSLRQDLRVITSSIVTPASFYGLAFKWTPVYGKITWLNEKITPFDVYMNAGLGLTGTNQGSSEPTLHLGTGQLFALTKSFAVRWDFTWNFYSAKGSGVSATRATYNNLFITAGASFFFPEAKYR